MPAPKRTDVPRVPLAPAAGGGTTVTLPAEVLAAAGLTDAVGGTVEVRVEDGRVLLGPKPDPRAGWEAAAKAIGEAEDEEPSMEFPNAFDDSEWEW